MTAKTQGLILSTIDLAFWMLRRFNRHLPLLAHSSSASLQVEIMTGDLTFDLFFLQVLSIRSTKTKHCMVGFSYTTRKHISCMSPDLTFDYFFPPALTPPLHRPPAFVIIENHFSFPCAFFQCIPHTLLSRIPLSSYSVWVLAILKTEDPFLPPWAFFKRILNTLLTPILVVNHLTLRSSHPTQWVSFLFPVGYLLVHSLYIAILNPPL
jgi:hypothetical protein